MQDEVNTWLTSLNSSSAFDSKIITYAGKYNRTKVHVIYNNGVVFLNELGFTGSDGAVPIESANFYNHNVANRPVFNDYEHSEMWQGKAGDNTLFNSLRQDLLNIATSVTAPGSFSFGVAQRCAGNAPVNVVTWGSSDRATSFRVYRDSLPLSSPLAVNVLEFRDNNITPGQQYSYKVTATSANGLTTDSPTIPLRAPNCTVPDTTAPGVPIITGNPTAWSRNNLFYVGWNNPSDPSGIAKVWYKLGSAPTASTDGTSLPLPLFNPLPITLNQSAGTQTVFLWLEDGAGNKNYHNNVPVTLRLDTTRPTIAITSHSTAVPYSTTQNTITLSGTFADTLSGVVSVTWLNNVGGSGTATTSGSANNGTWFTPPITLYSGLNNVIVTATDGAGSTASTALAVNFLDTSSSGSVTVTLTPQGAIDQGAQWRVNAGTWRNSGYTELNVPTGPRLVEFINVPGGYSTPASFGVNVIAGQNVSANGNYTPIVVAAPPNTPSNPTPAHGAVNVGRAQPRFSWSGAAPGGNLQYAFCIDINNFANPDPPQYTGWGSLTDNSFQFPGNTFTLPATTTVNWRVKARANGITVDGPLWRFTTEYAVADLAVKNLALDGNVEPGANVTLSATVENQGNFVAPLGYLFFYLSRIPGGKEIRLNLPVSLIVRELQPGQSTNITFSAKLDGLPAGQSFIDAWVDTTAYGATGESSFENNLTSIQLNYIDGKNPQVTYAALSKTFVKTGAANSIVYVATDDVGVKTMDFYYSTDDGVTWVPIQEGYVPTPPFAGADFNWTVPANLTVGANLKVRVVARDASGNWGETNAGSYLIHSGTAPTVTILSPNGGELWNMGSQQQIRWILSAPNGVSQFSVLFYHDNLIDFLPVSFSSTNGPYTWTLPAALATTTGKIRIQVQDLNGNNSEDFSDGFFSIRDTSSPPPAPWTSPQSLATNASSSSPLKVAADQVGNLHLIYGTPTGLQYTKKTGETWSSPASVTAVTGAVNTLNMAVDSQGHPHLV